MRRMYSQAQIKEIVAFMASKGELDFSKVDLAVKSLEASGEITGSNILETMSGYSFAQSTQTKGTLEIKYCGAVKTGNKLTLVIFGKYVRAVGATGYEPIGVFTIPSEVATKIIPFENSQIVDGRELAAYRTNNSYVECIGTIHKYSANNLTFELASVAPLTEQVEYFIRYEATFLLSNNLAPSGN